LYNAFALFSLCAITFAAAPPDRITTPIDANRLATLPGHVRRLADRYIDEGLVASSQQMGGLVLFMKPSAQQKAALDQLLVDVQDPASKSYHQWLTPEEYADRFAVSPSDAGRIAAWLETQGFQIGWIGRGRSVIVFNGTAGNVKTAFHTEIHRYRSAKAVHFANAQNPSVPEALRNVVGAIGGLDDFLPEPDQHAFPAYTSSNGTYSAGPDDLATIYDFATLISSGIDGTGQKIVVTGESDILAPDLAAYRARYNLPAPNVQTMLVPGFPDPGLGTANQNLLEADIDVELAGGVARNATVLYLYSGSAYNAVIYAIDQNLAPVITASFHVGCDASVAASELASYQAVAQQANVEGITWINSSGDIGAAGCDDNDQATASKGLATRFPADIPEVTGVGGTQFNASPAYWSGNNGPHGGSARSYIPETAWNSTTANAIQASNGGVSTFFPKPPWQAGPGVPNDGQRDTPDVAVSAGATIPYLINTNGTVVNQGATSSAAPVFAGMVVLLNQYLVANGAQRTPGVGNLNAMLYRIAQSNPAAFHDITAGNNIVPCTSGSPGCMDGKMGFTAGPGFDLCTGLGSIDLANLAAAAVVQPAPASLIVVSSNANPVYQTVNRNGVSSWAVTLTLTEEEGVATTVTGFSIDGKNYPVANWFTSPAIGAFGAASTIVSFDDNVIPNTHIFGFTGSDANGRAWNTSMSIPFVGIAPSSTGAIPAISGTTNAASFRQSYAPGMILSIFGSNLGAGTQAAAAVPLPTYMQNFEATVNGVLAPLYYVSPTQANVQIPYGTAPGTATLKVFQAGQSATSQIQIATAAPGIFADANGNTVPYASGAAGESLVLFITGDGEVTPALVTGSAPSTSIPVTSLPKSVLPVSMTIGGQPAQILFDGIPYGLAGVTQINFVVPSGLAAGPQPVMVTVGTVASQAATFTVTAGS
jgi:uncharacterized protein (TIGR03437 family)